MGLLQNAAGPLCIYERSDMSLLHMPAALLLYLAALLLTALGAVRKKGLALSYLGGLCWAGGSLLAWYGGTPPRELLAVALLLLLIEGLRMRREGGP